MIVPSTMVGGTSGCMPNACSAQPAPFLRSCTALTLLEPISSPMHCFAMAALRPRAGAVRYIVGCSGRISKNAPSPGESADPVLLHLVQQRAVADLQQLGGVRAIPLGYAEGAADEVGLHLTGRPLDRQRLGVTARRAGRDHG